MAYSGPTTGPPGEYVGYPAPDGHSYFEILGVPQGLLHTYAGLQTAIERCLGNAAKSKDPAVKSYWAGSAATLVAARRRFESRLRSLARDTANVATAAVISNIASTRTGRPATSKATHMEGNILSRPIAMSRPTGAVGIADMRVLNRTRRSRGKPYWAAQEFGTDAHVGRILPGYFMPGKSRPSAAEFRVHPEFRRQSRGRGVPAMNIQKPIEERGFLRTGTDIAGAHRRRKLATIEAELVRVVTQVASTAPPVPKPPPGTSRQRRP
jgi:hypothetical protein